MCTFCSLLVPLLFSIFFLFSISVLFIVILLFTVTPKHSAEVLPNVPKRKQAAMCLTEKICVLDKLRSGVSCSVVGREFTVNE